MSALCRLYLVLLYAHSSLLLYAHARLAACRLQSCCMQTLILLHADDRGLLLHYFFTCSALSIPLLPTWGSTALLQSAMFRLRQTCGRSGRRSLSRTSFLRVVPLSYVYVCVCVCVVIFGCSFLGVIFNQPCLLV